ncbi:MAG: hypothetical protein IJS08_17775, partial [Victivallales bacterium]|nr:hypothetical protein [Victivallales bacterium]
MKFPLVNTGRRFFFFTFVVEGRLPVLSRLERGQKRPILLPAGERIVEIWRQLHKIEPHFTASDFVIMPDHVHLLLIVNSEGKFRFNPLVFAHWFMDVTTDGGLRPPNPLLDSYQAGNGGSGAEPPSVVAPPTDWCSYY